MNATHLWQLASILLFYPVLHGSAGETLPAAGAAPVRQTYALSPNDLVLIKVYRHDDLESKLRIASDGTTSFPLLGTLQLGGKTLEEATVYIRELLGKDYLVNPQVTVTILE